MPTNDQTSVMEKIRHAAEMTGREDLIPILTATLELRKQAAALKGTTDIKKDFGFAVADILSAIQEKLDSVRLTEDDYMLLLATGE